MRSSHHRSPVPEPGASISTAGNQTPRPRRPAIESIAIAEEVASLLRHDFRNKFASILNAVSYIERSLGRMQLPEPDARISRFLQLIAEEVVAADGLLDVRARHAQRLSTDTEVLGLEHCVRQAVERTALPELVTLELVVEAEPQLRVHFEEVVLAVQCLLDNAVEAAAPRGHVRVTVSEDGTDFFVRVLDSGPGIPVDERARVVEPFVSGKPGHAGLGLNIASRLARRHGGRLLIDESQENSRAQACLAFAKRE